MTYLNIEISRDAVWSSFPVGIESINQSASESKLCIMVSDAMLETYGDDGLEECNVDIVDRMGTDVDTDKIEQIDYVKQVEGDVYSRFNWVVEN